MKRILSFLLAILLLISVIPTALATNDYTQGTQVVYQSSGSESYTITVPALLAPGSSGTVTLSGTWAENRTVNVTADPTVTLTNSIKSTDQKVLNVTFAGISELGSNTSSQTFAEPVSVDNITNALFGTWNGKFNYNVEITDMQSASVTPKESLNDYTWSEIKSIASGDADLSDYNIAIGDTISDGTYTFYLVSDERNEPYDGLVFMYAPDVSGKMNDTEVSAGGYFSSRMRSTVDGLLDSLPSDLQTAIKTTTVKSSDYGELDTVYSEDVKLFLPCLREICPDKEYGGSGGIALYDEEGSIFDFFNTTDHMSRVFQISNANLWFRSTTQANGFFWGVRNVAPTQSVIDAKSANSTRYIAPVFVIG